MFCCIEHLTISDSEGASYGGGKAAGLGSSRASLARSSEKRCDGSVCEQIMQEMVLEIGRLSSHGGRGSDGRGA